MAPNMTMTRTALYLNSLVLLFTSLFLNPRPTQAIGASQNILPSFSDFSRSVQNGKANELRGVYVPNVLALPVVQQPADSPYYVSSHKGEATQFSIASQYGNIGLLAHNNLSGESFSKLSVGQEVELVYENGGVEDFVITKVLRFQALQPQSQQSSFLDLDNSETLSANQMFNRVYTGSRHLTFQTCIKENGDASWG